MKSGPDLLRNHEALTAGAKWPGPGSKRQPGFWRSSMMRCAKGKTFFETQGSKKPAQAGFFDVALSIQS